MTLTVVVEPRTKRHPALPGRPDRLPVGRPHRPLARPSRSGLARSRRAARGSADWKSYAAAGVMAMVLAVTGTSVVAAAQVAAPTPAVPVVAQNCSATPAPGTIAGFAGEQLANAATILAVAKGMGAPPRASLVALATAMQESTLRNLDYGDRDSLGLFQQRPSQGWGSPAQVTDPVYSTTIFLQRLLEVPGWETMPVTVAAQTVQRSAFPDAYAKWANAAAAIIAATPVTCTPR